ncbi:uncharacterized protein HMPREF1541_05068 [Cyphellophora europaea CBS 101466]|uniref:Mitochondrial import inner membrane translocase subunit n=1 Tax=Cyphellophora europaea (strain CBS 101466) TaxID=1220924 RepID=W2RYB9_CYPE1|nr:uncharacterized protein HMPREF1541_05068 [Cyphellophora europaea CBS 101466]ETN40788.1 hypothetical protein HMPREF1541_05068 [Cyphellophora europaea CBS 101466]
MEGEDSYSISQETISRLSPADQRGLQEFIQAENQKNQVQADPLFDFPGRCLSRTDRTLPVNPMKCVTSISGGGLVTKEQGCMQSCVDRFMDSNLAVLKHLEQLRASQ